MDEGISVGIASHPLAQIPHILVKDGSPPLYYVLLHGWIGVVGQSEWQLHTLSLLLALATIPVGLWAGWTIFGRKAGWMVAAMAATSPYLTFFASETRMYTLVVLLSLVTVTAYVHVFVFGRGKYLPVFVVALAALLYTHNWGLLFYVAAGAGLVPCLLATSDRRLMLRRAAIGFGAVAAVYALWVPTLLAQIRHTGAPWSWRPTVREMVSVLADVLGDPHERVLVALVLTAGVALYAVLVGARTRRKTAVQALAIVATLTLVMGWASSQLRPAWSFRYLAVILPALLLLAGAGLAASGRRGVVALVLIVVFWTQPFGRLTGARVVAGRDAKSADHELASAVRPVLHSGDLVIAIQMEEVPVLHYYLGSRFEYADPRGVVADPQVADWTDATERLQAATTANVDPALESLPIGGHLFLVCNAASEKPDLEWFGIMDASCGAWKIQMGSSPSFRPVPVPALAELEEEGGRFLGVFEKVAP
jgi:mannosyltransferase